MSDETPGAGQGALSPREGQQGPRPATERPTMRLTGLQVAGGQYVLTTQPPGVPALTQITPGSALYTNSNLVQSGVTRIISISNSRTGQTSPLRPSLANQSIVNVLKSRANSNIRLQLFQQQQQSGTTDAASPPIASPNVPRPLKRPLSMTPDKKLDSYAAKLQRVKNHKIVRSKLLKERYNEHLLEAFYLEAGGNILDLFQYAKRAKTQAYLAYMKEHAIDPRDYPNEEPASTLPLPQPTPTATAVNSLPGISQTHPVLQTVTNASSSSTPTVSSTSAPIITTDVQSQITSSSTPTSTIPPKLALSTVKAKSLTNFAATPTTNQEQIVEKAKQEAYVVQRIAELQKDGLWSEKRLPKVQEMPRTKAHWDYLLEEMVWLAADFAQERKWKKAAAKKCARMVQKYFQDKASAAQRAEKAQEQHLRRIASYCAKEIKIFWNNVEKLVEYKQNTILEEKRKKALDQQLSFIVDQTEKYSQLLAEGMNKSVNDVPSSTMSSRSVSRAAAHSDDEFEPEMQSDEDDEETIEQEEAANTGDEQSEEIAALQRESQMELDDLLEDDALQNYLMNRDNIKLSEPEDSDDECLSKINKNNVDDEETSVDSESDEDIESEDDESESEVASTAPTSGELKLLVEDSHNNEGETTKTDEKDDLINDAAAIAESLQPKGNTLSSTIVSTKIPFLLKFTLREYQHIGLDWLVTMFERKLNGILADEMGLGKTIQTIALLAHLACEKENWGPHLIVVPTSVMLNWEMECKKWCPGFKILTYYGTQKERKLKRTGWTKPNAFHICITSYKLVIQDHQSFRRKKWKYLILDEAQNIKNFKSQRWQLLLNFQTHQRLLLTGTPLQNNLMELWSLMHFLMPNVFQSHREFKEWFSNPVTGMIEGNSEYNESIIKRLHKVLRPFLLRRLKSEVEKQMPKKYEHVVMCRLSKRQRFLYDDYMSRANTRETLASGNLLSVINVLMQLRKVCNHPNLFEVRPTISPFQCDGITFPIPSIVYAALEYDPFKHIDLISMNLSFITMEVYLSSFQCYRMQRMRTSNAMMEIICDTWAPPMPGGHMKMRVVRQESTEPIAPPPPPPKVVTPQNVKVKVSPQFQLVSQQGVLKSIPVVNMTQATSSGQIANAVNVSPGLKSGDKISASFAQIVQTSTGKHLLFTSNPNITGNIPVSPAAGGQKLTVLSKQPVNTGHQITKAFVKFQLTSVTTATTSTASTTTSSATSSPIVAEEVRRTVGNNFIEKIYANQSNSLDVRWSSSDEDVSSRGDEKSRLQTSRRLKLMSRINQRRCSAYPMYGCDFRDAVKIFVPNKKHSWSGGRINCLNAIWNGPVLEATTNCLRDFMYTPARRIDQLKDISERFIFYVPPVRAAEPEMRVLRPTPSKYWGEIRRKQLLKRTLAMPATPLHQLASAMVTQFPDPRLIQYDCGKLQTMDKLLRKLKMGSHRVLIFTQMTKMLDVLEAFLNFHGHIYLRLDGTTKVDQRQVLMERFNGDTRIFAFILSTRSGGVGVNLTGADTVIFYDSDWNPTMDAQAQDRCHRIGQTRDVHIYRLISERTIEENILKKANQKRLLGDLAIEGGNFTTAFFKSSTIKDLFNVDNSEGSAANRMSEVVESKERVRKISASETAPVSTSDERAAFEHALTACEDDQDVMAAKCAKAEAVADLAEFDENIPLEDLNKEKEPELSKAEQEIDNVIKKLSPVERYAMRFIEETESAWSVEQLKAAEREIEEQKREWERNRVAAMREEEERRARELEEEGDIITFSREDATNQIWVSDNTSEQMPMWCPPTPPEQHTDVYIDQSMSFLYDVNIMSETELPPIYVRKEAKRTRLDAGLVDSRRQLKLPRKEESTNAPKSLFHSPTILKMRRDMKLQKYRGLIRPSAPVPGKSNATNKPTNGEQAPYHEWTIHEDMALLKVVQTFQGLPLNLVVLTPAHTPNWDFVADYVNTVSITYRSPKQCRYRYESTLMQREEGKQTFDNSIKKKKNKSPLQKFTIQPKSNRPMRTSQLFTQDNNSMFSQVMIDRYEALKVITNKRLPAPRTSLGTGTIKNNKQTALLTECGIDLDHPVLPVEIAVRRAERIAKEKKITPEQLARYQLMKSAGAVPQVVAASAASVSQVAASSSSTIATVVSAPTQIVVSQAPPIATTIVASPGTPPNTLRTQRIIASPMQNPTVVSVSGLTQHLQTARLIATANSGQAKGVVGTSATIQGKTFSSAQLQYIRQATNLKQPLRLHPGNLTTQGGVKTSTVTIGGQQAVVQFTQAQQARPQFVRQGTVTVSGKTRTVTESEVAQLLKMQQQKIQQQKLAAAVAAQQQQVGGSAGGTVQGLTGQVFAQAIQQAGTSGTPVATLVKAVSSAGVTQTVTIPVSGVTLAAAQGKSITPLKTTNAQQLRQIQQQLMAQKKLSGQKLSIAQVSGGKNSVPTQLIVGHKPLSTAMTVQQFQQVIRSPLNAGQGPLVLAKGPSRVINTAQGTKQTIQVVAATSQALTTALRPQSSSALAGALTGIKVQGAASSQQALISQVSAALNQNSRQNSPVRLQTTSGGPLVAVTVQSANVQGTTPQTTTADQVSRFLKK